MRPSTRLFYAKKLLELSKNALFTGTEKNQFDFYKSEYAIEKMNLNDSSNIIN